MSSTTSAPNRPQRSSGNKAHPLRPIYLISKTPYNGVIHIPILTISFFKPDIDFTRYQGIILTSKQSLVALKQYDFHWERLRCICVSEGTAEAARQAGAHNLYVGNGYGQSIPEVMKRESLEGRWLYLRPKVIASEWVDVSLSNGIMIDEAVVYETTCNKEASGLHIEDNGVLIFTSPSSIECFSKWYKILPTHSVVAIGKTTAKLFETAKEVHISPETSIPSAIKLAREIAQK